jgi:nucleoside-diphosphate-sugar epimerase
MKIVLTGSEGFIGSSLKKKLLRKKHQLVCYDLSLNKDIKDFTLDGDENFVIHLAAKANVKDSVKNPEPYFLNNVEYSKKIFDLCYEKKIPCLYASSSCIHNWSLSPYGETKKKMEEAARDGQIGLRFSTVYGENPRKGMLFDYIVNGTVKYKTNHKRDFIYIDDVVNAILLFVKLGLKDKNKTYEVSSGQLYSVKEVIEEAGFKVPLRKGDPCEAESNASDNSELKKLGWEPTMTVWSFLRNLDLDKVLKFGSL